MRIQVKSTLKAERHNRYRFGVCRGGIKEAYTVAQADIIALVAIDIKRVYFMPTKDLTTTTIRKGVGDYSPFVEAETWHGSINKVIGSQWSD